MSEVRLAVPPHHGQLRLWGKCHDTWFALIEWQAQCNDLRLHGGSHRGLLFCTAWVEAEHVAKLDGQDYDGVPRVTLGPNPQLWPTRLRGGKTSPPQDHYFGLLDGSPIPAPPGVVWLEGHGSLYG